jgi:hyperosmotically inducible periplasmic protein
MRAALGSLFVIGALVAAPWSTYAAEQAAAAQPSDKTIDDRAEARIHKDATLKKYNIDVSVDHGVVTLTGTVPTAADSSKAESLARVEGATRVDNKLIVDLNAGTKGTAGTLKEKTKEGAEKTKGGAEKVGEKTKAGLSKTGEEITDGWITSRVHSKFVGEDLLKDSDINVDTNDHVVTLKGTVMSAAAKARAEQQAKEVEGVRRVVNQLVVGPKK